METGTITSKGQTTIPKAIRDKLGLKAGDKVVFSIEGDKVVLRAKTLSVDDWAGCLKRPGQLPVSIEEMNEAIAEGAVAAQSGAKRSGS